MYSKKLIMDQFLSNNDLVDRLEASTYSNECQDEYKTTLVSLNLN